MKIINPIRILLLPVFIAILVLFYSCNKNNTAPGTEEYIHCTVNGAPYNFDAPADNLNTPDSFETLPFIADQFIASGKRIPQASNDFAYLAVNKTGIAQGSIQALNTFHIPQITGYAYNITGYSTAASPVMVNITEYGLPGQYIAGNFTCVLTEPAPVNTQYTITCNFRVKRKS
ncbi:hypothetical protein [Ferruginibacter sp.]